MVFFLFVGYVLGYKNTLETFDLDVLSKVAEIISSIATTIGVVVAVFALTSWKSQFLNTKLDALLDDLEDEFGKLIRTIASYRYSQIMVTKSETNSGAPLGYQELKKQENIEQDNYLKQRDKYSVAFERIHRHYNLDSAKSINPSNIAREVVPIFQEIRNIYTQEDIRESDVLLKKNEQKLEKFMGYLQRTISSSPK